MQIFGYARNKYSARLHDDLIRMSSCATKRNTFLTFLTTKCIFLISLLIILIQKRVFYHRSLDSLSRFRYIGCWETYHQRETLCEVGKETDEEGRARGRERGMQHGCVDGAEEAPTGRCDLLAGGSCVQMISKKLQSAENPFTSLFFADRSFLSSLISPRLDR